jgi:molybdopterin converting factor small subunit
MHIRVLFFARGREIIGVSEVSIEVSQGTEPMPLVVVGSAK